VADNDSERSDREVGRRGPDVLTLIFGIGTLLVSAFVLTDGALWIPSLDPRWLVAGGALVVGLFLLTASLRGGRKRR
jgi:hypothetical protein